MNPDDYDSARVCRNCVCWDDGARSDGNGNCTAFDILYKTAPADLGNGATLTVKADYDQGLDATLVTGPDFWCAGFTG